MEDPVPSKIDPESSPPAWLLVHEVAAELRMTRRGVEKMIAEGRLPAYRVGKRALRVRRSDVDALMVPVRTAGGAA